MNQIKDVLRKILPEDFILWTHKARAIMANIFYWFPSRKLKVIGITGTNGKTTTSIMTAKILEEAGHKVAMATTVRFKIGRDEWNNNSKMTTINPFKLQKFLYDAVSVGCDFAIIETTSHAIKQYRNWGIYYNIAVLTNVTHDHLDYHKNFGEYRNTKLRMFQNHPKASVVNCDDPSYVTFAKQETDKVFLYGLENKADVTAKKIIMNSTGSYFNLITPSGQIPIDLKIPGRFNIYNAMAAATASLANGISLEKIKAGLNKSENIPGRMEMLKAPKEKGGFNIIIDFAHTPDGLQKVLESVGSFTKGKIIHVGGATGARDKTKRPILGALSGKYADITIVTDEDPYNEDPQTIIDEVSAGVPRGAAKGNKKILEKNFFKILDRQEAIAKALSLAGENDVVLITGKGGEEVMAVGDKLIPYSDKKVVEGILQTKN